MSDETGTPIAPMTSALRGGLPANPDDLVKGLANVNQQLQGSTGGRPLLRLLKSGIFAYGPENIEPEPGSEWAINVYSLEHGFACWGDAELLGESMVPFNQNPPIKGELPDYGYEWTQQVSMLMQCMTGEDEGQVVLYKGTSTGLRNAVKAIIDQVIAQAQIDKEHIVPVVELEVDSYVHKKYGEIFYPVLDIKHWVSIEDGATAPETEAEPEKQEAAPEEETAKPRRGKVKSDTQAAGNSGSRRRRRRG